MNKQQTTFDDFFSECYLKYREYIKNYIAIRICHPHEYNRQIKKFPTEKQNVSLKHILT